MTTYTEAKARRHELALAREEFLHREDRDFQKWMDRRLAELERQALLASFDA